jgi:lipopolysaccharide export system protein LptA
MEESKSPESNVPSEVNADNVDYDMKSGVVTATGNVLLKHGADRATGERAMYNVNTQESYLVGNVIVVRQDLRVTCNSLQNNGAGHIQADGNVYGVQTVAPNEKYPKGDTRTFKGEHIDYYPDDKGHFVIQNGGVLTSQVEGNFTADFMEGWLDEEYYTGTGNVHLLNPPKEIEAGGDKIDYYAKENGKAVLTGNAWAIQKNNTLRGNRLTVYLADEQKEIKSDQPQKNILPHEDVSKNRN